MNKFINNSECNTLRLDLIHSSRRVHHTLDNYGVDMEVELKEALERLQRATEEALQIIGSYSF